MKNEMIRSEGTSSRTGKYVFVLLIMAVTIVPAPASDVFTEPVTAEGEVIVIEGRLSDLSGGTVNRGTVEIWQTDARGIYDHPQDSTTRNRDSGFQFYGSSQVDSNGQYRFRTILPGRYEPRPRHIHVKVKLDGRVLLITQIYFNEDGDTRGTGGSNQSLRVDIQTRRTGDGKQQKFAVFDIVVDSGNPGNLRPTASQGEGPYYPITNVSRFDNDLANVR